MLTPPEKKYERREFDPSARGLEGLEWDSAELYMVGRKIYTIWIECALEGITESLVVLQLTATETKNYDDAFTLEQV